MRERDRDEAQALSAALRRYEATFGALPGIAADAARETLIEQIVESRRRVRYYGYLVDAPLGAERMVPGARFDPLKAAVLRHRRGELDEACWLIFLFVHFGRHRRAKWRYARDVYGRLGDGGTWDWPSVSADPDGFRHWLHENVDPLQADGPRGFGNHRKRESLAAWSDRGTGAAVATYVGWVSSAGDHQTLFEAALARNDGSPTAAFRDLYESMHFVASFGRLARFDYLSTVGRLRIAPILPDSAHLSGSSGPLRGARLLFGGGSAATLDSRLDEVEAVLGVGYDVLEDAICNWQKNPNEFRPFRG